LLQVDTELRCGAQDHAGPGLAVDRLAFVASHAMFRMKRTEVHLGDRRPVRAKHLAHPVGEREKLVLAVIPPADSGLIGNHDDQEATCNGLAAGVEYPVDEFERVFAADIIAVHIDHAVAIEKKRSVHQRSTSASSTCARA